MSIRGLNQLWHFFFFYLIIFGWRKGEEDEQTITGEDRIQDLLVISTLLQVLSKLQNSR